MPPSIPESSGGVIQAAGGLVWRDSPTGHELLVIRRNRYGDWTLPKGKLEPGESWMDAALREVREETGCEAAIEGFAGCMCYTVSGVPKVVLYWHMHIAGEHQFSASEEVGEANWMSLDQALAWLDYPGERELVRQGRLS